jgi:predicted 3-demethylubiquinone-9 3-methyltransferase (glyoxalase superfamily)
LAIRISELRIAATADHDPPASQDPLSQGETENDQDPPENHNFLWFDNQAEEAARFYTSLFDDSRIVAISRYPDAVPDKAGSLMLVTFKLAGPKFHALNGGSQYKFNEAISLFVECETQGEIDECWSRLAEGGKECPCDRFGLSWQVAPTRAAGTAVRRRSRDRCRCDARDVRDEKIVIADIERAARPGHH